MLAAMKALLIAVAVNSALPAGFVDIHDVAPDILVDMRYATDNNFMGTRVDGYNSGRCILTTEAATALAKTQRALDAFGLRLKVFDCYRPQRAVDHFVRWSRDAEDTGTKTAYYPRLSKADLFPQGYIAEQSGHSRGSTLDLTIDGLSMGGPFDYFDETSHTAHPAIGPQARANRLLLKQVLEKHGFRNYPKEWWHFTLKTEPYPDTYFDFPIR